MLGKMIFSHISISCGKFGKVWILQAVMKPLNWPGPSVARGLTAFYNSSSRLHCYSGSHSITPASGLICLHAAEWGVDRVANAESCIFGGGRTAEIRDVVCTLWGHTSHSVVTFNMLWHTDYPPPPIYEHMNLPRFMQGGHVQWNYVMLIQKKVKILHKNGTKLAKCNASNNWRSCNVNVDSYPGCLC